MVNKITSCPWCHHAVDVVCESLRCFVQCNFCRARGPMNLMSRDAIEQWDSIAKINHEPTIVAANNEDKPPKPLSDGAELDMSDEATLIAFDKHFTRTDPTNVNIYIGWRACWNYLRGMMKDKQ